MEIPAWAETLFEKFVVVFETPSSDALEAAGSTDLLPWIDSLLVEIPLLVENVKANVFPASFLTNVLGFKPESLGRLPLLLTLFVVLYLACGGLTVALRLKRGQTSLLPFTRQAFNAVLIWAAFLLVPMRRLLAENPGGDGIYPLLALGGVLLCVVIPLTSVARYLWFYRLTGIPHAVFDVGFGLFAFSVALLAAKSADILWVLVILAMAALTVVQWEGREEYPEEEPRKEPRPAQKPLRKSPAPPEPARTGTPAAKAPAAEAPPPTVEEILSESGKTDTHS